MRILILAFALLPAAAIAQDRSAAPTALQTAALKCQNPRNSWAAQPPTTLKVRPLGEEPLADRYLGVVRRIDGCDRPVKVAEKIGNEQR